MNAPRDPWADFEEVFADVLALPEPSADEMQAMADEYQRAAIAGAQEPERGYEVENTK